MNIALIAIFVILQVADIGLTLKALELGKREKNAFLRRAFEYFNPLKVMVAIKSVGVVALIAIDSYLITMACCAVYVWVVINNWSVIKSRP